MWGRRLDGPALSNADIIILLQQENAPGHTACKVINYFLDSNIKSISWPQNSADLNIIGKYLEDPKVQVNFEIN